MDIEQQAGETVPEAAPAEETEKPRRRTARKRTAASAAPAPEAGTTAAAAVPTEEPGVAGADAAAAAAPEKPKRAPRSRKKAAPAEPAAVAPAPEEAAASEQVPAEGAPAEAAIREPAPVRSRRRASARAAAAQADSKSAAATPAPEIEAPAQAAEAPAQAAEAPARAAEAPADEPAAPVSRAKSSVRARRRAAGSVPTPAPAMEAAAPASEAAAEQAAPVTDARSGQAPAGEAAVVAPAAHAAAVREAEQAAPAAGEAPAAAGEEEPQDQELTGFAALFSDASPTSLLFQAPDLSAIVRAASAQEPEDEEEAEEDEETLPSRRRRRSRGRRGRIRAGEEAGEEGEDEESEGDAEAVTSRRRRRRRRGEVDLELTGGEDDDPPNTVTRVRAPRTPAEGTANRVQSVKGSTRLEAKKQRRRESRESGRRRHVITEAEFLARRESVDRQMVVRQKEDRIQIAVLEDGVLAEHFVSKTQQDSLIGNVYLGKVQNVLPSMEAAFVDIGRGRNAVLYAGEVNWDAAGLDGAPRRIENALKSGDSVLVQVTKDPVGHKGARLTSQISLPGRYLVYVPGGSMTGISRKLPDVERNRLKRILKDRLPEDAGVIVRTAAEGASEEELTHDINRLRAQWESIQAQASSTKVLAPELLYGEPDLTIKVVRDVFNEDFSKLIVSGDEAWDTIEAYVTYVAPDLLGRLEKYQGEDDVFSQWRIDEQINKALDRKVFLPSGGSLVIDRTEAMTVIDVNTGKFTGSGGNLEETVTKNNLEAAEEIVRQLRLRDVGGIIVIDFIDMVLESNRDLVLRRLVECLGRDRTKHQVAEVTSLGLVQMTRKRMGTGLLEVFSETCEVCAGRGVITHEEPVERGSRPSVSVAEPQQARPDANGGSGRKRRRRGGQGSEAPPAPAAALSAPVAAPADDAQRQARAQATRAALAAVAAAAHAAHVHDDEVAAARAAESSAPQQAPAASAGSPAAGTSPAETPRAETRGETSVGEGGTPEVPAAFAAPAAPEAPQGHFGLSVPSASAPRLPAPPVADHGAPAVLTIGGERIQLPHGDAPAEPPAPAPILSLDDLSHAFDELTGERHTPSEGGERPGRRRRSRGARSGQGSAEVTRVDEPSGAVGGQTRSATAPAPSRTAEPGAGGPDEGDGPLILGVGVPASEL